MPSDVNRDTDPSELDSEKDDRAEELVRVSTFVSTHVPYAVNNNINSPGCFVPPTGRLQMPARTVSRICVSCGLRFDAVEILVSVWALDE